MNMAGRNFFPPFAFFLSSVTHHSHPLDGAYHYMSVTHMPRHVVPDIIAQFTCYFGCRHRISISLNRITKTSSPWCLVWDHYYVIGCGCCKARAARTWQVVKITQHATEAEAIDACVRLLCILRGREGWAELPTTPLYG